MAALGAFVLATRTLPRWAAHKTIAAFATIVAAGVSLATADASMSVPVLVLVGVLMLIEIIAAAFAAKPWGFGSNTARGELESSTGEMNNKKKKKLKADLARSMAANPICR